VTTVSSGVRLAEAELPYLDVHDEAFLSDPFAVLSDVRAHSALARSARGVEVLTYDLVASLLNDRRLDVVTWEYFAQKGAPEIMLDYLEKGLLSNMSRERHLRVRRIFVQGFRPAMVEAQRPLLPVIGNRLIDDVIDRGRCDVVNDFGGRFSIEVMCALIGIPPADISRFSHATMELALIFATPLDPVRDRLDAALHTLREYSLDLIQARRALVPAERPDDFVSSLVTLQEQGEAIEGDELMWGISNLLFGAMDTTRFQIARVTQAMIANGLWEQIAADGALVDGLLEEAIRIAPVVGFVPRRVEQELELAGVVIPPGTVLMLNLLAANRDPGRFPDPYRFDITRPLGGRLIFGHGLHKCLGDRLAWMIMEVATELFTLRMRDVRVVEERTLTPCNEQLIGHDQLVIEFEPR
jgi:cytochrome P450